MRRVELIDCQKFAGIAQLVERQLPKLNVEGSNPFARFGFGGDGWRGCGGGSVERNRTGVRWCPARAQTANRVVESTGLAALRERG